MNNCYILIIVVLNILQLYRKEISISDQIVSKGPIGVVFILVFSTAYL